MTINGASIVQIGNKTIFCLSDIVKINERGTRPLQYKLEFHRANKSPPKRAKAMRKISQMLLLPQVSGFAEAIAISSAGIVRVC